MSEEEKQVATLPRWAETIKKTEDKFLEIINDSGADVSFAAESMFAFQIISKNDYSQKIATANLTSLRDAIINVAAIGLSLNPAMQYAYLVPRDNMICLDISYKGLIKLATDTGSMMWVRADLVYEKDKFVYHGPAMAPEHDANIFGERGQFVGVYCIAKTLEGDILAEAMTAKEIEQVKATSKAGMKGPWKEWFGEMAKKTIIKRASKTWPRSDKNDRLAKAVDVINQHEGSNDSEEIQLYTPAGKIASNFTDKQVDGWIGLCNESAKRNDTDAFSSWFEAHKEDILKDCNQDGLEVVRMHWEKLVRATQPE